VTCVSVRRRRRPGGACAANSKPRLFTSGTTPASLRLPQRAPKTVARIVKTIGVYDDFCHVNDPYEEHDFGSFEVDGHTIFFKIDYFDSTLTVHSPDPSDPAVTKY
jgi:hypothetical protein